MSRQTQQQSRFAVSDVLSSSFQVSAAVSLACHPNERSLTGNPGAVTMYRHFLMKPHQSLGLPVIALSHVGQIREGIERFRRPLTVRKLVEHKVDFVENVIPQDVQVVLIGHSIGTFIATQVMRLVERRERVVHAVLLMPVLEKFTQTPGWKALSFMLYFRALFYVLVLLLSLLKDDIALRLMTHLSSDLKRHRTPDCVLEGLLQLLDWRVARNILTLAADEAVQVQERDDCFLHRSLQHLSLFYSVDDQWSPLTLFRNLKRRFPSCYAEVMDTVSHSFVTDRRMTDEVVTRVVARLQSQLTDGGGGCSTRDED